MVRISITPKLAALFEIHRGVLPCTYIPTQPYACLYYCTGQVLLYGLVEFGAVGNVNSRPCNLPGHDDVLGRSMAEI